MSRWGMLADLERCVGCQTCTAACRHANATSPAVQWRKVLDVETGSFPDVSRVFVPVGCQHCADPPCVHVCPTTATRQRPDGIVTIDYGLCIGCAYCEVACPYQARFLVHEPHHAYAAGAMPNETERYDDERLGVAQKCTFCVERIDFGLEHGLTPGIDPRATPACVNACIADALHFGDLDDPDSNVSRLLAEQKHFRMHDELGTAPNFFYLYGRADEPNGKVDDATDGADNAVHPPSALVRGDEGAGYASPPLCGEGSGVGVGECGMPSPARHDPPPQPSPTKGEGVAHAARTAQASRLRAKGVEPWHQPHWDWKAAANFLCGGAGAGLFAFAAAASLRGTSVRPAVLLALGLIATGLAVLIFKIGRPRRFIYVLLQPQRSWMTREAWVATAFFPVALASLWFGNAALTIAAVVLGLAFLFCQAMILKAAKGVPIWRARNMVPLVVSTGLTEGGGVFLCAAAVWPLPGLGIFTAAAFVALLAAARAWEWRCYFAHLVKDGAPARSLEILRACRGWLLPLGFVAPAVLIVLGFMLPAAANVLFAAAGLVVFAAGWVLKFIMITCAAYNQGFALPHTPVRGSGLPGGAVKPGWAS